MLLYTAPDGKFQITKRDVSDASDSVPDYDSSDAALLLEELHQNIPVRKVLFQLLSRRKVPILYTDPSSPFDELEVMPDTGFLAPETIFIVKKTGAESGPAKELVTKMIELGLLIRDRTTIVHCKDCAAYSFGMVNPAKPKRSFGCVKCVKSCGSGTAVFRLKAETMDMLLGGTGRVLEGLIYRSLANNPRITERFSVVFGAQLVTTTAGEDTLRGEKDVFLIDKLGKIPPIAVLVSISANSRSEKKQILQCADLGIPAIYVTAGATSDESAIATAAWKVYRNAFQEDGYPATLAGDIMDELVPALEAGQTIGIPTIS